jgi:hypothetical protein
MDAGFVANMWSLAANSFSVVVGSVAVAAVLCVRKLHLAYHFQLALLMAGCEVLASVLQIMIDAADTSGSVGGGWMAPLYTWDVQLFQLSSAGFFFSLIAFVWVTVDKPHVYSVRKKRGSLLAINASVVVLLSLSVCAGVYLSERAHSSHWSISVAESEFRTAHEAVLFLVFLWSLLVVGNLMYILFVGGAHSEPSLYM